VSVSLILFQSNEFGCVRIGPQVMILPSEGSTLSSFEKFFAFDFFPAASSVFELEADSPSGKSVILGKL